jgi:hypothetical protein
MPPDLHAELARAAEREGVSLNGYITGKLGASVGWRQAQPASHPDQQERRASRTVVWALIANAVAVVLAATAALVILLVALFN